MDAFKTQKKQKIANTYFLKKKHKKSITKEKPRTSSWIIGFNEGGLRLHQNEIYFTATKSYKSCFCVCAFFFHSSEADIFLLTSTIVNFTLIKDFFLVVRLELDETRSKLIEHNSYFRKS